MSNTPDDWGSFYERCSICGNRYHASEGGCGCTDDKAQCGACGHWFDEDEVEHGMCEDCRACSSCDEEDTAYYEDAGRWLCQECAIADGLIDAVTALASVAPERRVERLEEDQ